MADEPIQELAEELRTRLGAAFEVDPPEYGRLDLCSKTNGLEAKICMDGGRYEVTTDLYALAPHSGIGLHKRDPDSAKAPERLEVYMREIQHIYEGAGENSWA
jgi:hypothetical protein